MARILSTGTREWDEGLQNKREVSKKTSFHKREDCHVKFVGQIQIVEFTVEGTTGTAKIREWTVENKTKQNPNSC